MGNKTLAVGVLAGIITLVTVPAFADGPSADDVFAQGLVLQQNKQCSSALDAFRRAYRIKATPMSLLHIAECEIALGRLVKAEEHLHALVDATMLEGSPPEFLATQAQGKIELDELTPRVRVGHITVRLPPSNAESMIVTLDGWTLDATQLGVAQRVDPGSHVIVLIANNRVPMTTTLTVAEGQSVVSDVPVGVFASVRRDDKYTVPFSTGLAVGGYAIMGLGLAATGGGAAILAGSAFLCALGGCSGTGDELGPVIAVGGALVISGLSAAFAIGLPMITAGNRRVPHVAVSPRGAQLGWTF